MPASTRCSPAGAPAAPWWWCRRSCAATCTALAGLLVEQRIEKAILPVVVLAAARGDLRRPRGASAACARSPRPASGCRPTGPWRRCCARLPGCAFHNHYGPSETHVATAFTLSPDPEDWEVYPSIGRPIGNSTAYVLEPRSGAGSGSGSARCPRRLYLGGACLARGYLGRPDLTAERFVPDPFGVEPGARLYRTGDKVRLRPTGDWSTSAVSTTRSRSAASASSRARSRRLLLALPGVREAVVVVREDRPAGSGDRRLVAYVVGDVRRPTRCADPCASGCRTTWCRPPSWCSRRCR